MKKNSLKAFIAEIRISVRVMLETIKLLTQAGWMNLVVITTMAAILSIFGVLFRTSLAMSSFIESIGSDLEISVYIKSNAATRDAIFKIKNIPEVSKVTLTSKEKAWSDMKRQMKVPDIKNPLPDTLHVKLKKQAYSDVVISKVKKMDEVEDVRFTKDLSDRIKMVSDIGKIVTVVVLIILGSLTMFIISNTIQLAIQSKRTEIEIMRFMGVYNWYIKAPFILQGGIYGLSGAILALIPLNITQSYIERAAAFFGISSNPLSINLVMLSLFAMGIIVGAGGSIMSIRKYLKV
ncbi:MAG: permease-like cell division protein FtsX [Candidatus Gastranaerophilales bacterium]|nr:permease-like cell division protein FtsX [Candidatus Gastranaerophilales bacterium]